MNPDTQFLQNLDDAFNKRGIETIIPLMRPNVKWANGLENYTFEENNGTTTITVDFDCTEEFLDYMNETYPKALDKLKEICEN